MTTTVFRIQLTSDTVLRAKLRNKLAEYQERLAHQFNDSSLPYKIAVLENLFAVGFVDIQALRQRLSAIPTFSEADFSEALQIVSAYNENQLDRLRNGTGLR